MKDVPQQYKDNNCTEIEYFFSNADFSNKSDFSQAITCINILQKINVLYQNVMPDTTIINRKHWILYYSSNDVFAV